MNRNVSIAFVDSLSPPRRLGWVQLGLSAALGEAERCRSSMKTGSAGCVQRVAVVRSDGGSKRSDPLLMAPDRGCVFAAASLTDVVTELKNHFQAESNGTLPARTSKGR